MTKDSMQNCFPAATEAKGETTMQKQRVIKDYDELKYNDDFMFTKVMEDRGLCRKVLECLLQRPVGELIEVQTQKEFRYYSDGKPIRLDVYNRDSDGIIYDTEMQNLNNKSLESHQFPRRSRFYQAAIDMDFMEKGNSYKKLPDSNVVFICTFDPFGKGLSRYTFTECCEEDDAIHLSDGTSKIFYNCCYEGEDIPENLKKFYHYVETGEAGDDLTRSIEQAVDKGRKNEAWRSQYMKEVVLIQDAIDEGIEIGIEQGIGQGIEQSIEKMLRRGRTVEEIVDFCGYPYEQVKKVADSMTKFE